MMQKNHTPLKAAVLAGLLLLAATLACRAFPAAEPTPAPLPAATTTTSEVLARSTPVSDLPAAGICQEVDGSEVTMRINPDIPDPRCLRVRPDQFLTVANNRAESIEVRFGPFVLNLESGAARRLDRPFGEYLAWGVHVVQSTPCCGGEIWLDPALSP